MVTGPPGAGKSTVAASLDPQVLVEGDAFFAFLRRDAIDPWLPASHAQNAAVTEAAAAASGRLAASGLDVVYDGVVGPWFVGLFLAASGLDSLDYAVLLPPAERCVEGVRTRVGHGFTDEPATRKMHAEFAAAVADEAVEPRHVVDPSDLDPTGVAALLRRNQSVGALRYP